MDRYQRLLCKKYLEILAKTEEMKELREAAAILQELEKLRHPGEAAPGGGVVELG